MVASHAGVFVLGIKQKFEIQIQTQILKFENRNRNLGFENQNRKQKGEPQRLGRIPSSAQDSYCAVPLSLHSSSIAHLHFTLHVARLTTLD